MWLSMKTPRFSERGLVVEIEGKDYVIVPAVGGEEKLICNLVQLAGTTMTQ